MSKKSPVYSPQFREQMVELVSTGRSASDLAREFGCHATSISTWVRQAQSRGQPAIVSGTALNTHERQELERLRKEVRVLKTERDILSKATAWFANNGAVTPTGSTRS